MAGTQDALDSMAPWDAASYFQQMKEHVLVLGMTGTAQLVTADPNRVGLIVSVAALGAATLSMSASGSTSDGIPFTTQALTIRLLFAETGPLCQQAWWIYAGNSIHVTWYEISLYRWPDLAAAKVREAKRVSRPKPK